MRSGGGSSVLMVMEQEAGRSLCLRTSEHPSSPGQFTFGCCLCIKTELNSYLDFCYLGFYVTLIKF